MPKMKNEDGKICNADVDQVKAMEKAGWKVCTAEDGEQTAAYIPPVKDAKDRIIEKMQAELAAAQAELAKTKGEAGEVTKGEDSTNSTEKKTAAKPAAATAAKPAAKTQAK